jgi:hypothetical protein
VQSVDSAMVTGAESNRSVARGHRRAYGVNVVGDDPYIKAYWDERSGTSNYDPSPEAWAGRLAAQQQRQSEEAGPPKPVIFGNAVPHSPPAVFTPSGSYSAPSDVSVTPSYFGNAYPRSSTASLGDAEPFSWKPLAALARWLAYGFLFFCVLRAVRFAYDECPQLYQHFPATFFIAISVNILLYVPWKRERPAVRSRAREFVVPAFLRARKPKLRWKVPARALAGMMLVPVVCAYIVHNSDRPLVNYGVTNIDASAVRGGTVVHSMPAAKAGAVAKAQQRSPKPVRPSGGVDAEPKGNLPPLPYKQPLPATTTGGPYI